MTELEEIVSRKNYELNINWDCEACGKRTRIIGCVLPGEPAYEDQKSIITWDDILHKKCDYCNLVRRPLRKCSACKSIHDFNSFGCNICNGIISKVIDMEKEVNSLIESIRKGKRKKIDVSKEEEKYHELRIKLSDLGYSPCKLCGSVYGKGDYFTCKDCLE